MLQVSFDPTNADEAAWVLNNVLSTEMPLVGDSRQTDAGPSSSGSGSPEGTPAATPARQTRGKGRQAAPGEVEPFIVLNAPDRERARYTDPKDAADCLIVAASTAETEEELGEFIDINLKTLARLPKDQQERVKTEMAKTVTNLKAKSTAAAADAGTTDKPEATDLDAMMGGDGEAETPAISSEDFNKAMVAFMQKAGPTAARVFGEPIIKKYGAMKNIPASDYALVLAASEEFLAKIAK